MTRPEDHERFAELQDDLSAAFDELDSGLLQARLEALDECKKSPRREGCRASRRVLRRRPQFSGDRRAVGPVGEKRL